MGKPSDWLQLFSSSLHTIVHVEVGNPKKFYGYERIQGSVVVNNQIAKKPLNVFRQRNDAYSGARVVLTFNI